jgi:hypothetical protein
LLIALLQTPHRFRSKRQLWAYCGLALRTYDSGECRFVGGQLKRSRKAVTIRGLNKNHNHDLKNIFKGAATRAAAVAGPFQNFYEACMANGMKPAMARLTLARKIAAITLLVWKKGVRRPLLDAWECRVTRGATGGNRSILRQASTVGLKPCISMSLGHPVT